MLFLVRAKRDRFDKEYVPVDVIDATDSKAAMEKANRGLPGMPSLKVSPLTEKVRSELQEQGIVVCKDGTACGFAKCSGLHLCQM